eukprot:g9791.t1
MHGGGITADNAAKLTGMVQTRTADDVKGRSSRTRHQSSGRQGHRLGEPGADMLRTHEGGWRESNGANEEVLTGAIEGGSGRPQSRGLRTRDGTTDGEKGNKNAPSGTQGDKFETLGQERHLGAGECEEDVHGVVQELHSELRTILGEIGAETDPGTTNGALAVQAEAADTFRVGFSVFFPSTRARARLLRDIMKKIATAGSPSPKYAQHNNDKEIRRRSHGKSQTKLRQRVLPALKTNSIVHLAVEALARDDYAAGLVLGAFSQNGPGGDKQEDHESMSEESDQVIDAGELDAAMESLLLHCVDDLHTRLWPEDVCDLGGATRTCCGQEEAPCPYSRLLLVLQEHAVTYWGNMDGAAVKQDSARELSLAHAVRLLEQSLKIFTRLLAEGDQPGGGARANRYTVNGHDVLEKLKNSFVSLVPVLCGSVVAVSAEGGCFLSLAARLLPLVVPLLRAVDRFGSPRPPEGACPSPGWLAELEQAIAMLSADLTCGLIDMKGLRIRHDPEFSAQEAGRGGAPSQRGNQIEVLVELLLTSSPFLACGPESFDWSGLEDEDAVKPDGSYFSQMLEVIAFQENVTQEVCGCSQPPRAPTPALRTTASNPTPGHPHLQHSLAHGQRRASHDVATKLSPIDVSVSAHGFSDQQSPARAPALNQGSAKAGAKGEAQGIGGKGGEATGRQLDSIVDEARAEGFIQDLLCGRGAAQSLYLWMTVPPESHVPLVAAAAAEVREALAGLAGSLEEDRCLDESSSEKDRIRQNDESRRRGREKDSGYGNFSEEAAPRAQSAAASTFANIMRNCRFLLKSTARLPSIELARGQRWYYEVTLLTGGLMQLGWAGPGFECNPTRGQGVGDHTRSWAFDGFRQKRWCVSSAPYGKRWRRGDVIGISLDAELQEMRFSMNGRDLGVAYVGFDMEGLFPACSMNVGQAALFNFGHSPFLYTPPTDSGGLCFRPVLEAVRHCSSVEVVGQCFTGGIGEDQAEPVRDDDHARDGTHEVMPRGTRGRNTAVGTERSYDEGYMQGGETEDISRLELERQGLVENLIGMGFPVEWAIRAAGRSGSVMSESAATAWIIERLEIENTKMEEEMGNIDTCEEDSAGGNSGIGDEYNDDTGESEDGDAHTAATGLRYPSDAAGIERGAADGVAGADEGTGDRRWHDMYNAVRRSFIAGGNGESPATAGAFTPGAAADVGWTADASVSSPPIVAEALVAQGEGAMPDGLRHDTHGLKNIAMSAIEGDLPSLSLVLDTALSILFARAAMVNLLMHVAKSLVKYSCPSLGLQPTTMKGSGVGDVEDTLVAMEVARGMLKTLTAPENQQSVVDLTKTLVMCSAPLRSVNTPVTFLMPSLSRESPSQAGMRNTAVVCRNESMEDFQPACLNCWKAVAPIGLHPGSCTLGVKSLLDLVHAFVEPRMEAVSATSITVSWGDWFETDDEPELQVGLGSGDCLARPSAIGKVPGTSDLAQALRSKLKHAASRQQDEDGPSLVLKVRACGLWGSEPFRVAALDLHGRGCLKVYGLAPDTCYSFRLERRVASPSPAIPALAADLSDDEGSCPLSAATIGANSTGESSADQLGADIADAASALTGLDGSGGGGGGGGSTCSEGCTTVLTDESQRQEGQASCCTSSTRAVAGRNSRRFITDRYTNKRMEFQWPSMGGRDRFCATSEDFVTGRANGAIVATMSVATPPEVPFMLDAEGCGPNLRLSRSNLTVTNTGRKKWSAVRATRGFACGVHRWKVRIDRCVSKNVFVGVMSSESRLNNYVGSDKTGWGYLANKAIWHNKGKIRSYGDLFREGDTIGVTLNMDLGTLRFARNGRDLGLAVQGLEGILYPAVSMYNRSDQLTLIPPEDHAAPTPTPSSDVNVGGEGDAGAALVGGLLYGTFSADCVLPWAQTSREVDKSVFGQVARHLSRRTSHVLSEGPMAFFVELVDASVFVDGEAAKDESLELPDARANGDSRYRGVLWQVCAEVCSPPIAMFVSADTGGATAAATPTAPDPVAAGIEINNGAGEGRGADLGGTNVDVATKEFCVEGLVPNPLFTSKGMSPVCMDPERVALYRSLGIIVGLAVRSGVPLPLSHLSPKWSRSYYPEASTFL